MKGHQYIIRAIIADLENQFGASAVLPITTDLSNADEKLRAMYERLVVETKAKGAAA